MKISALNEYFEKHCHSLFKKLYGTENIERQKNRYLNALKKTISVFQWSPDTDIGIYSAPGRTEICGNHTDHQGGQAVASAIDLDLIAFVVKNNSNIITIQSQGFEKFSISSDNLKIYSEEYGTSSALLRGTASWFLNKNYTIGGFDAYIVSDVPEGTGLSSSAAFEILLGTIFSYEFNNGTITPMDLALCAQYAENNYFGKPCGLLDQLACVTGGLIHIDFSKKQPMVNKINANLQNAGFCLYVVNTGGDHKDLTADYQNITLQMSEIATYFEKNLLCQVNESDFFSAISILKTTYSHLSILRAIHYFNECRRVNILPTLLENQDYDNFLQLIQASGNSSALYLQNLYSLSNPHTQPLVLDLALCEKTLGTKGAYRIHGGGFAGTIQAYVPYDLCKNFERKMTAVFGAGSCHKLYLRPEGAMKII